MPKSLIIFTETYAKAEKRLKKSFLTNAISSTDVDDTVVVQEDVPQVLTEADVATILGDIPTLQRERDGK